MCIRVLSNKIYNPAITMVKSLERNKLGMCLTVTFDDIKTWYGHVRILEILRSSK